MTPKQLADLIDVPEKTLAQWRYLKRGPQFLKLEGAVRYRMADVEAWIEASVVPTTG